jgi:hypothetical protein
MDQILTSSGVLYTQEHWDRSDISNITTVTIKKWVETHECTWNETYLSFK